MLQVVPENVDIIINAHKATIVAEHVLLRSLTVLYLPLMRNQCMYLHIHNERVSVYVCVKIHVYVRVFMCMYMMHAYDMAHS